MRKLNVVLMVLLGVCSAVFGADTFIQVICDPGVKIFLNGELMGEANAEDGGLILNEVNPGTHRLKAVLDGFIPQEVELKVRDGEVKECRLPAFVRQGETAQDAVTVETGTLAIQSVPVHCRIVISDTPYTELNALMKTTDKWTSGKIPVGRHRIRATSRGKTLEYSIDLAHHELIHLLFNFMSGEVKELTKAEVAPGKAIGLAGDLRSIDMGNGVEMSFVSIPAGEFMMGAKKGKKNQRPEHKVVLEEPFWMAATEITQRQYEQVMGENPSKFKGADRPVETVSWDDAITFCRRLTEREQQAGRLPEGYEYALPSEAQWEYACRAGSPEVDKELLEASAWIGRNSRKTQPVGQKQANAWGLHDMLGNVWEWCMDDWHKSYDDAPSDGSSWGTGNGLLRIMRGGSWDSKASDCRSTTRRSDERTHKNRYLGFRPIIRKK